MDTPGIFTLAPPVQSFPLSAVAAGTAVIFTGRGRLYGWSISGAATAVGELFDGPAATGARIGNFQATANAFPGQWFGPQGIDVQSQLTLVVSIAALTGVIYYQTETLVNDWLAEIQSRAGVRYSTGQNWAGVPITLGE